MPVDAKAPTEVVADLPTADTRNIYTRVAQLPPSLRRALTKTFHQRELFIPDAGQPVQETDVIIATRGYKPLPTRRLEFAFRMRSFWIVYYSSWGYEHASTALVFSYSRARFVWGGVEFEPSRSAAGAGPSD